MCHNNFRLLASLDLLIGDASDSAQRTSKAGAWQASFKRIDARGSARRVASR